MSKLEIEIKGLGTQDEKKITELKKQLNKYKKEVKQVPDLSGLEPSPQEALRLTKLAKKVSNKKYCRCSGSCVSCICKKAGRFCNDRCHKRQKNSKCKNCDVT